jgi:WSC domain
MRVYLLIALLCELPGALSQSTVTPENSINATIYPGTSKWEYYGCYNETTLTNGTNGARALSGGTSEAQDTMTVGTCLDFCASGSYQYAGLEYTRQVHLQTSIAQ